MDVWTRSMQMRLDKNAFEIDIWTWGNENVSVLIRLNLK
jgi:hypothetical protein